MGKKQSNPLPPPLRLGPMPFVNLSPKQKKSYAITKKELIKALELFDDDDVIVFKDEECILGDAECLYKDGTWYVVFGDGSAFSDE